MFEKTREIIRKDRYGFPDEEFPHRVVIMGNPQASLSRKELSLMTGCEPILAGDIQDNPAYDRSLPPPPRRISSSPSLSRPNCSAAPATLSATAKPSIWSMACANIA